MQHQVEAGQRTELDQQPLICDAAPENTWRPVTGSHRGHDQTALVDGSHRGLPRHVARALLRSRLRVRHHPGGRADGARGQRAERAQRHARPGHAVVVLVRVRVAGQHRPRRRGRCAVRPVRGDGRDVRRRADDPGGVRRPARRPARPAGPGRLLRRGPQPPSRPVLVRQRWRRRAAPTDPRDGRGDVVRRGGAGRRGVHRRLGADRAVGARTRDRADRHAGRRHIRLAPQLGGALGGGTVWSSSSPSASPSSRSASG